MLSLGDEILPSIVKLTIMNGTWGQRHLAHLGLYDPHGRDLNATFRPLHAQRRPPIF